MQMKCKVRYFSKLFNYSSPAYISKMPKAGESFPFIQEQAIRSSGNLFNTKYSKTILMKDDIKTYYNKQFSLGINSQEVISNI